MVRIPGIRTDDFIVSLDLHGVAASSGSACSSGKQEVSHVLLAMGFTEEIARESVRFSFREDFQPDELPELVSRISECICANRNGLSLELNEAYGS